MPVPLHKDGDSEVAAKASGESFRIAVISSPRSGNTWVRTLLGTILELEQFAVHRPSDIPWNTLPARCVIQIHWRPDRTILDMLERFGVRVLVLARHPLDVLMSVLNYTNYTHLEGLCAGPAACAECAIVGKSPTSPEFLEFACGPAADDVFSHSKLWWGAPAVFRARYEDLVARPEATLSRLIEDLGERPRRPIDEAIAATSIGRLKSNRDAWHFHYWQGQSGIWKTLIPAEAAKRIAGANPETFSVLGYACDPDESLTTAQAELVWAQLQLGSVRANLAEERNRRSATELELERARNDIESQLLSLWEARSLHSETRDALAAARGDRERILRTIYDDRCESAATQAELQTTREALERAQRRLASVEGIGARSRDLARLLSRLAQRCRASSSRVRRFLSARFEIGGSPARDAAAPRAESGLKWRFDSAELDARPTETAERRIGSTLAK
jgi:Sulfotransferase domain